MMKTLMLKNNKQDPTLMSNISEKSHLGKSGKLDAQLNHNKEKMK